MIYEFCKENGFEVIEHNIYKTTIRIEYGVVLYITKYKADESYKQSCFYYMPSEFKGKIKKIKGVSKGYDVIEDVNYCNEVILKGSMLIDGIVALLRNKNEYYYELKLASGNYSGDIQKLKGMQDNLNKIMSFMGE